MTRAGLEVMKSLGREPSGGIVIAPEEAPVLHPSLIHRTGDHPEPGARSFRAAADLGDILRQVPEEDEVWIFLSGGTTSLIAAPEVGVTPDDLTGLYSLLLGSGLDISEMNRIRKRFSRWGGGKLARALGRHEVRVYVVSDVIGDDLAAIASGPCVPDPTTAAEIRALLERAGLWPRLPDSARQLLASTEAGLIAETPKPGDPAFARVTLELVVSNRLALEAAAKRAAELGLAPLVVETPIAGEASVTGASVAAILLYNCGRSSIPQPSCMIWGGEATVTLSGPAAGLGGRCQELALAAARVLAHAPEPVALLAAGTDGRDGPTDAAGAVVDQSTWGSIQQAGRDPSHDLAAHDAYRSLEAAGALLRTGLTGTNVMDVVVGVCGVEAGSGEARDAAAARA